MTLTIESLHAVEILDSRARPTLAVHLRTTGGVVARAGVPAGASTGSREAVELRDHDQSRYGGQGVRAAVRSVNQEIAKEFVGREFDSTESLDRALIDLDGTVNKSRLGANAVLGVSVAAVRADAEARGEQLWQRIAALAGTEPRLPVPHFNVVNGGAHARNDLDFQEFMLAPLGAGSMRDAVRAGAEVYAKLRGLLTARGLATGLGDEGGFAPEVADPAEVLGLLVDAVKSAGYRADCSGVAFAIDPAASEFHRGGVYHLASGPRSTEQMIDWYADLVERFPVWSLEDPLGEHDEAGWPMITDRLGETMQIMGDDNFVTNPEIIAAAVDAGVANSSLIKLNQIGTVTETLQAMRVCRDAGYTQMVSHRSGETADSFIADLAVGTGCGQLKSGAPARGERVAKYNRLLEIEDSAEGAALPYGLTPEARVR